MHIENADSTLTHLYTIMTQEAEDMMARTINKTRTLKPCFQLILYAQYTREHCLIINDVSDMKEYNCNHIYTHIFITRRNIFELNLSIM